MAVRQGQHNDWMNMMERASILKRAEQNANTSARMNTDGSVVIPSPATAQNVNPLPQARPTRQEPNVNAPKWTVITDRFGRSIRVYHESAQADELNQFLIYAQELFNMAGGVNEVAKQLGVSPVEAGKQLYNIWRKAKRKTSRGEMTDKGRKSLKELRSNPNW